MSELVNGLGGSAGFGEHALASGGSWSAATIDLSGYYSPGQGLNFLGNFYSAVWVNSAGYVQFRPADAGRADLGAIPPTSVGALNAATQGDDIAPIIAPYWAPIDTSRTPLAASPGGTSTGANKVWYDVDAATGVVTITWDDVRPAQGGTKSIAAADDDVAAFQMEIRPVTGLGTAAADFDVIFRYESLGWGPFTFLDGANTIGDAPRALIADFATIRNSHYVVTEPRPSVATTIDADSVDGPDRDAIAGMATDSNVGEAGTWRFAYRQGWLTAEASADTGAAIEGTGTGTTFASVTVSLMAGVSHSVTLDWEALSGDGFGDADLATDLLAKTGSITIDPWERSKTILIPIARDSSIEGDETFTLRLTAPAPNAANPGGVLLRQSDAVVTIFDDDSPLLSINDVIASEDSGPFVFTVTRSSATGTSSATYTVQAGSAAAGTDFTAATGTVSFADGETSKTISVQVAADTLVETDETFNVLLSDPIGARLSDFVAFGGIINDDTSITFAAATRTDARQTETTLEDLTIRIRALRQGVDLGALTVDWTMEGLADAGRGFQGMTAADFAGGVLPSGTLVFAAGQTQAFFNVTFAGDTLHEAAPEQARFKITSTLPTGTTAVLGTLVIEDLDTDLGWFTGTDTGNRITGGAGADSMLGLGGPDSLSGMAGADQLRGGDGDDVLDGGLDSDLLIGGDGSDRLRAGDGADTLEGGTGNDFLYGDAGDDSLQGDDGVDSLQGGAGNDGMQGGAGADALRGQDGNDGLRGDAGADSLYGDAGADTLSGGTDDDLLRGGTGHDSIEGGTGQDTIAGEDGDDRLAGDEGADMLQGGRGADTMSGGADNDRLQGQDDVDWLSGDAGDDSLIGGGGADTLQGGLGSDRLTGEAGADIFRYLGLDESWASTPDRILDFQAGQDRLDVSGIDADAVAAGDQAFAFIGSAAFSGGVGVAQARLYISGTTTWLALDSGDADATPEFMIRLISATGVTVADLVL